MRDACQRIVRICSGRRIMGVQRSMAVRQDRRMRRRRMRGRK